MVITTPAKDTVASRSTAFPADCVPNIIRNTDVMTRSVPQAGAFPTSGRHLAEKTLLQGLRGTCHTGQDDSCHPKTQTGEGFPSPAGAARNNNQCYPLRLRRG